MTPFVLAASMSAGFAGMAAVLMTRHAILLVPVAPSPTSRLEGLADRFGLESDTVRRFAPWVAAGAVVGFVFVGPLVLVLLVGAIPLTRFLLARRSRRQAEHAAREVPYLLDVLAACATAGLSIPAALEHGARLTRGALASHLQTVIDEARAGRRWHDSLAALAGQVDAPELHRAIGVLRRAERLGVPLADTLVPLAADARARHFSAAMDRARKAPVKMLFPLVFLVLPAFLLLTVVPVMVSTFGSI